MPPGPQAAVRLCLCKGRSSEHLLVTWLRFRTPNSWFSMHFFFSCRPLTPTPTLENTSFSQLVLHLLSPNKAHSSGCDVLEKWNGRWEEVNLLATARACVCPRRATTLLCKEGWTNTAPPYQKRRRKPTQRIFSRFPRFPGLELRKSVKIHVLLKPAFVLWPVRPTFLILFA